jgi:hypothetical protein
MPFGVSFAATCVFFIDVCGWIFSCGCRSLWAGADMACNVHALTAPHCPFCVRGVAGYAGVIILVCLPQLACSLRMTWSVTVRVIACVALFPASMIVVGLMLGWYDGYWR